MEFVFLIIIFIFSVILHEISHGAMANYLGDPTAKYAGRLTLNPVKHIDPVGSILLPGVMFFMTRLTGFGIIFGWAKPVPINPFNFRDKKYGSLKVAFAGPASNLVLAFVFAMPIRFLPGEIAALGIGRMFVYVVYINLMLAIFNLIPIPPLDGSHILFTFLRSPKFDAVKIALYQFGFAAILIFVYFFSGWIFLAVSKIFSLLTGLSL